VCELADKHLVNNNYLPYTKELSSVAAVGSRSPAFAVEEVGLPIPIIHARVISPTAELPAEFCDDGLPDAAQSSDVEIGTVAMSIPVLITRHMSPLKRGSNLSAAMQPLMTPVDDFSHTVPTICGQSGRKQAKREGAVEHKALSHLVKQASDLDEAAATLTPCAECDISTLPSEPLTGTVLTPVPLTTQEPVCLLPSVPVFVPAGHLTVSVTGLYSNTDTVKAAVSFPSPLSCQTVFSTGTTIAQSSVPHYCSSQTTV